MADNERRKIRVPPELVADVEQYQHWREQQDPDINVTFQGAAASLLRMGLRAWKERVQRRRQTDWLERIHTRDNIIDDDDDESDPEGVSALLT